MIIASLRTRLFVGMTAIILLTGGIGGWLAYQWAYDEAIELQDSVLAQIGSFVQAGAVGGIGRVHGADADSEITVEEISTADCANKQSCAVAGLPDGLHLTMLHGESVRALLTTNPVGRRFAVTQRTALRDELAGDFAIRSLLPIAALIPILMLVTALVIAASLRPVVRLTRELEQRRADDLSMLSTRSVPSEIVPFITAINGLFERIAAMMVRQRRFVADAAHELRTPVTALSLQVENVAQVDLPPLARERMATLKDGVRRIRYLLDQLLSLARQDTDRMVERERVDLGHIVKTATAELLAMAERKGIDVGFAELEAAHINANAFDIATMVRNLVGNAVRFTPTGGRVDIYVRKDDRVAIFEVLDSGPGVAKASIDRLFEPFYRSTETAEDGTGLGLAIVKRIVDHANGSITLRNLADDGAAGLMVTVQLPLASGSVDEGGNGPKASSAFA